jgi:hypothetical protein
MRGSQVWSLPVLLSWGYQFWWPLPPYAVGSTDLGEPLCPFPACFMA